MIGARTWITRHCAGRFCDFVNKAGGLGQAAWPLFSRR